MSRFLAALAARPLVLDGGMGTRLIGLGLDLATDGPALWNLARPEDVRDSHARDVAAGSDCLLTNTFGADRVDLDRFGMAGNVGAINARAVEIAREVAGPGRFLLGSISPRAGCADGGYESQAEALVEAGIDALFLETHTPNEAGDGLKRLRRRFSLPIVVGLITISKHDARGLIDHGADILGLNCCHPAEVRAWAEQLAPDSPIPLLSEPYASHPDHGEISPADFAAIVPDLIGHGVRLLGGCCGATDAHIAALRSALDRVRADRV